MEKYYAGIGSRSTPKDILKLFESLGRYLATCNFILRSGGADGADMKLYILAYNLCECTIVWMLGYSLVNTIVSSTSCCQYVSEC